MHVPEWKFQEKMQGIRDYKKKIDMEIDDAYDFGMISIDTTKAKKRIFKVLDEVYAELGDKLRQDFLNVVNLITREYYVIERDVTAEHDRIGMIIK